MGHANPPLFEVALKADPGSREQLRARVRSQSIPAALEQHFSEWASLSRFYIYIFALGGLAVPIILVFTKYDLLVSEVDRGWEQPDDDIIEAEAEKKFDLRCGNRLQELKRSVNYNLPYVKASIRYRSTLWRLVQATEDALGIISPSVLKVAPFPPSKISFNSKNSDTVKLVEGGISYNGGFCDISMGIHLPTGRLLAMRRPHVGTDLAVQGIIACFREEAKMWGSFDHINILPFFGLVELGDKIYMASPWMENGDLSRFLRHLPQDTNTGRLPQQSTLPDSIVASFDERKTISEIAAGVAYLHSINYVHGDIKAANILLAADWHALLCDFGLTKVVDQVTKIVYKGVGSIRWMAPELFDEEPKSLATDVYAFSMTVVEVLTRQLPYPTKSDVIVMKTVSISDGRPLLEPLSREGRDFNPLWSIATSCWRTKPEDRPGMAEVLAKLGVGSG